MAPPMIYKQDEVSETCSLVNTVQRTPTARALAEAQIEGSSCQGH